MIEEGYNVKVNERKTHNFTLDGHYYQYYENNTA